MNKIILLFGFFITLPFLSVAQDFKYGWKIGLSIGNNSDVGIPITTDNQTFDLNLKRSKKDFSVGAWGSIKISKFYIIPEVMVNTFAMEYLLKGPKITGVDTLKSDRFYRLDVPLMLGYRIGKNVILKAGPSMHVNLGGKSDLTSFSTFTAKYQPVLFGYQFGVGFNTGKKVQIDFRFNRFFDNYGDHIYFDNKQTPFPHKFRRLFLGLQFAL